MPTLSAASRRSLAGAIKAQGRALGFQQIGVATLDLAADEALLEAWLAKGFHGEMGYLARHGRRRSRPAELIPGTLSVIAAALDYLPPDAADMQDTLNNPQRAYVARYALGRDYHKVMRSKLRRLANGISEQIGPYGYRVFSDSAPVLEKALARNAGLGWIGKHTNLLNREHGSWFFLGEIYTDLELPSDPPHTENYCGSCTRCLEVCPTQAIIAPYTLDARRCIAYLTIELKGAIPVEFRSLIGNRIFGCDDCQIHCPWNRYAAVTAESDFRVRHALDASDLLTLWAWDEATFLARTEGSAIRRVNFEQWQRNLAVALGNVPSDQNVAEALKAQLPTASPLVCEHIQWALAQHGARG
jgi:epoxyqueuosine reductase